MLKRLLSAAALLLCITAVHGAIPSYIDTAANHIQMNGADWSRLRGELASLASGRDTVVRMLHIGDSHIQAEFVTNELRRQLQEKYGNAGRGLISPLRLAGTNQPTDYRITYADGSQDTKSDQARLLKCPWPVRPGVTGIAVRPEKDCAIVWENLGDGHEIKSFTLLPSDVTLLNTMGGKSLTTPIQAGQSVYGAITENGRPGIIYSAIGNNGACFNDYLLIDNFASATRIFKPSLIVLSMGTNEGFSYMTDEEIERSVRDLIRLLRHNHPDAAFLVLLPMECQKNRNHGRRPLSPYYDINVHVARAKDIIESAARKEGVPVWDFYAVAGGQGASDKWLADGLMNTDRIHLRKPGYELQAQLLYQALSEALKQ